AGNWIGLNAAGTAVLGNSSDGILISGGIQNRIGTNADGVADPLEANVIVGSAAYGIDISDPGAAQNVVAGNYVGVNPAGTAAMPNSSGGVLLEAGALNNMIGGSTAAARNVISGNTGTGVTITGTGTTGNVVAGNYIGVNKDGQGLIPGTVSWWKAEGN